MPAVASLGSINVDRIRRVASADLDDLEARYDWFPAPGETRRVASVPGAVADAAERTRLGGKGANQAVAAGRAGVPTALFGMVGEDEADHDVLDTLAADVDVAGVERVDGPTGTAYVFVEPDGENRIALVEGANACVDADYVRRHLDAIRGADCLLLQNEIPVEAAAFLLSELRGVTARPTVVVDPAPVAGADRLVTEPAVDYVTPNEVEYDQLASAGALDDFEGTVVQTRGAEDVVVSAGRTERFRVSPPPADVVDTTGAGDTFDGYLAAWLAAGRPLRDAVTAAATASARAVEAEGAQPAIPSVDALAVSP